MAIKPIKVTEAREIIRQLNRLNLETADYGNLKNLVGRLIYGIPMMAITPHEETRFYRGVVHKAKPAETKQLGYPPSVLTVNFQRCNPPGKSMFYCSPDPAAVFYELHVQPGDAVYLSKWSLANKFFVNRIAPRGDEGPRSAVREIISTYFETKFSQPVHETYSSQYKITSSISETLSTGNVIGGTAPIGGLTYPSVVHPNRSENIAVQPHIVDQCLRLDYVEELLVTAVDGYIIRYDRKDFSSNFEDGKIHWSGVPLKWTLPPGSMGTMTVEADGWIVRDEQGNIVNPG